MQRCEFDSIEDTFNFGRYNGLSLADVLDFDIQYFDWCVKFCTGVEILVHDSVMEQIRAAYPNFVIDNVFEENRKLHLYR